MIAHNHIYLFSFFLKAMPGMNKLLKENNPKSKCGSINIRYIIINMFLLKTHSKLNLQLNKEDIFPS